jgi:hypothetical protein
MSKRAKRPLSPNAARRAKDRDAEKARRDLERLDAASRGGSAERPIELESASQVEPDAEARPCPLCGGSMRLVSHDAPEGLRVARVICRRCHVERSRFYRLAARSLN